MIKAMRQMRLMELFFEEILAVYLFTALAVVSASIMDHDNIIEELIRWFTDAESEMFCTIMSLIIMAVTFIFRFIRVGIQHVHERKLMRRK